MSGAVRHHNAPPQVARREVLDATPLLAADGVTDDYATLQALIDQAIAERKQLLLAPGTIRCSQGLVAPSDTFVMRGWHTGLSTLQFDSNVDYDALTLGNGLGSGTRRNIHICDFEIMGPDPAPVGDGTFAQQHRAGVMLNGVKLPLVEAITVHNFGVGFDAKANCYGAEFRQCYAPFSENRYGMRIRTGTESGADWTITDCWLSGMLGGVAIEAFSAGYTFRGGQISGGHTLSGPDDTRGCVTVGLNLEDESVGGARNIHFDTVNFEGMHNLWCIRTYEPIRGIAFDTVHFIPSGNQGGDEPIGVWKGTTQWDTQIGLRQCVVGDGLNNRWVGENGHIMSSDGFSWTAFPDYFEDGTWGTWACVGDTEERLANETGLFGDAQIPHWGRYGAQHMHMGGVALRGEQGVIEKSIDYGATWSSIEGAAGAGSNVVISEADPPADLPAGTVYYKVADAAADPLQVLDTWVVPSA